MLLYGPDYSRLIYDISRIGYNITFICLDDNEAVSSNYLAGSNSSSPFVGMHFEQFECEDTERYQERLHDIFYENEYFPEFLSDICEQLILGNSIMLTMTNYEPIVLEYLTSIITREIGVIAYEITNVEDIQDHMERPNKVLLSNGILRE